MMGSSCTKVCTHGGQTALSNTLKAPPHGKESPNQSERDRRSCSMGYLQPLSTPIFLSPQKLCYMRSLHRHHSIHDGIILHKGVHSWRPNYPFQHVISSATWEGITQPSPKRSNIMFHGYLQPHNAKEGNPMSPHFSCTYNNN